MGTVHLKGDSMSEGFTYYKSFYEGIQNLDDATYRRMNDALMRYALYGEEPELTGLEESLFISWKANIDASNRRKENGAKGGRPTKDKSMVSEVKSMVSDDESIVSEEKPNIKETITETIKETENKKESKRFAPPSIDDVREYCRERKNKVDPETFIDFYSAKGWKVGNQPMKDWKAAVRTWEKRDRASPKNDKIHFDNERDYDMDALEERMLAATRAKNRRIV